MKRTTNNAARKGQLAVVRPDDHNGLLAHFAQCPELFAPMLNLIASGKQTIESVMNQAGRAVVELLLQLSATSIAGEKSPGRHSGEVLWHGNQGGQICLLERRLKVSKPRLRSRGRRGREVAVPLYEQLQSDSGLATRMSEILVSGRKYARVLPAMAASAGIAKSSVSRAVKRASEASLRQLMERSFTEHDILGVYIDGIEWPAITWWLLWDWTTAVRSTCWDWCAAPARTRGWSKTCCKVWSSAASMQACRVCS